MAAPVVQVPLPSQTCALTSPAWQIPTPPEVPATALLRQAPAPSHRPSAPHAALPVDPGVGFGHASFGSESTRIGPHLPLSPVVFSAARQDMHAPVQA